MSVATLPSDRIILSHGHARIVFRHDGGLTRLADLYQHDPLRVLFPTPPPGEPPTAVLVTTSGGLVGGDLSGGQQQQLAIARALVTRPGLLLLDEPTEGIQPSIIKDIGRVISKLAARSDMAIVLVEQYFDFARDLADAFIVMDRGEVVIAGRKDDMVEADVRRYLTV